MNSQKVVTTLAVRHILQPTVFNQNIQSSTNNDYQLYFDSSISNL